MVFAGEAALEPEQLQKILAEGSVQEEVRAA